MSLRLISRTAFALALAAAPLQVQVARADDGPPPPRPMAPDDAPDEGDRPAPPLPRGFGFDQAGPRTGGGMLGPAFLSFNEVRAGETTDQRRQRLLQPYLAILPTLSAAQQTHILAILDAASAEMRAANADTTLSPQGRASATRYLRSDLSNRIALALTTDQLATYNAQLVRPNPVGQIGGFGPGQGGPGGFGDGGGFGGEGGPGGGGGEGFGGESPEQLRARLLKGYEDVMDELSVKQKTDILAILKTADAQSANVRADTTHSVAAKTDALQAIHDEVNAKVLPLLEADQVADWKKAHAAKARDLAKLAATPLPPQPQQQGPGQGEGEGRGPGQGQPQPWVGF